MLWGNGANHGHLLIPNLCQRNKRSDLILYLLIFNEITKLMRLQQQPQALIIFHFIYWEQQDDIGLCEFFVFVQFPPFSKTSWVTCTSTTFWICGQYCARCKSSLSCSKSTSLSVWTVHCVTVSTCKWAVCTCAMLNRGCALCERKIRHSVTCKCSWLTALPFNMCVVSLSGSVAVPKRDAWKFLRLLN